MIYVNDYRSLQRISAGMANNAFDYTALLGKMVRVFTTHGKGSFNGLLIQALPDAIVLAHFPVRPGNLPSKTTIVKSHIVAVTQHFL